MNSLGLWIQESEGSSALPVISGGYMTSEWLITGDLTLTAWLSWCLSVFSSVKLLFLPFHSLFFGIESLSPAHIQEGGVPKNFWTYVKTTIAMVWWRYFEAMQISLFLLKICPLIFSMHQWVLLVSIYYCGVLVVIFYPFINLIIKVYNTGTLSKVHLLPFNSVSFTCIFE